MAWRRRLSILQIVFSPYSEWIDAFENNGSFILSILQIVFLGWRRVFKSEIGDFFQFFRLYSKKKRNKSVDTESFESFQFFRLYSPQPRRQFRYKPHCLLLSILQIVFMCPAVSVLLSQRQLRDSHYLSILQIVFYL